VLPRPPLDRLSWPTSHSSVHSCRVVGADASASRQVFAFWCHRGATVAAPGFYARAPCHHIEPAVDAWQLLLLATAAPHLWSTTPRSAIMPHCTCPARQLHVTTACAHCPALQPHVALQASSARGHRTCPAVQPHVALQASSACGHRTCPAVQPHVALQASSACGHRTCPAVQPHVALQASSACGHCTCPAVQPHVALHASSARGHCIWPALQLQLWLLHKLDTSAAMVAATSAQHFRLR
jgi:hypothetical protein